MNIPANTIENTMPDNNSPDQVLVIDSLTKKFGNFTAVDNIDLRVNRGEIFGFLGPNGAGKTTTIKMIAGLLKPDSGQILYWKGFLYPFAETICSNQSGSRY